MPSVVVVASFGDRNVVVVDPRLRGVAGSGGGGGGGAGVGDSVRLVNTYGTNFATTDYPFFIYVPAQSDVTNAGTTFSFDTGTPDRVTVLRDCLVSAHVELSPQIPLPPDCGIVSTYFQADVDDFNTFTNCVPQLTNDNIQSIVQTNIVVSVVAGQAMGIGLGVDVPVPVLFNGFLDVIALT